MALPRLAKQTVYRLRGTRVTDEYQDSVLDWSNPSRLRIDNCMFQPQAGEENTVGREAIVTRWEWFGPPNVDVEAHDRIEYRGIVYDIDGSVTRPEGVGLDHTHAVCRRVDG